MDDVVDIIPERIDPQTKKWNQYVAYHGILGSGDINSSLIFHLPACVYLYFPHSQRIRYDKETK